MASTRASADGDTGQATASSDRIEPPWELFRRYGSLRVTSAAAEQPGLIGSPNLPRPLRGLDAAAKRGVAAALDALEVRA